MIRTKKRIHVCAALIVLNLMVIWGNSLLSGEDSGAMSGSVMAWIMAVLRLPETAADTLHLLIRKGAHFTEFACLALLITWLCGMLGQKGFHLAVMPVLCGMAAALVDESIQLVTPDRGPSLTDVWIDTFGAAAGMCLLLIGYHLKKRKSKRNHLEETT